MPNSSSDIYVNRFDLLKLLKRIGRMIDRATQITKDDQTRAERL